MHISNTSFCLRFLTFMVILTFSTGMSQNLRPEAQLWEQASADTSVLGQLLSITDSLLDSQPKLGKQYLDRLEPLVQHQSDRHYLARFYFLKGYYYKITGQYQKAFQEYIRCSRIAEEIGWTWLYLKSENSIAATYGQLRSYKKSNRKYRELLPKALKYGDTHLLLMIYTNLANNLLFQQKYDSARYYYEKAYQYTTPGTFQRAAVEVNLANMCVKTGQLKQAREHAFSAARYARENQIWELYLECMLNIANSYIREGNFPQVVRYSLEALPVAKEHHLRPQLHNIYGNLASGYEGVGNFRKAYEYQVRYSNLRDSLFNESMSRQINELNVKYETEKKDKEILLQKSELRRRALIIRFMTIGGVGVIVFLLIIWRFYTKQREAYRMLVEKYLELTRNREMTSREKSPRGEKNSTLPFTPGKLRQILKNLEDILNSEKPFLQPDFTIEKLSHRLNIHSRYLSQIINEVYGQNFPNFINKLRVEEAVRMFGQEKYNHYSIEGISRTVGFQSKSSFIGAFKKFTGVTPGYFRKQMERMGEKGIQRN